MKRRSFVLAMAAAPLSHYVLAQPANTATATDEKKLRVGFDTSFMPFEFRKVNADGKPGEYVGFDIDLWDAIAKKNGWAYQKKAMDFNGLLLALQTGQLDVALAGINITDARRAVVDFSAPYYDSGLSVVVRQGNDDIHSPQDLDGKRIAAKLGTATVDWIKKHLPKATLQLYPNIDEAYRVLEAGRVDAVMHDTPNVLFYAHTEGREKVKVVGKPVPADQYGIAFPKGSKLVAPTNDALQQLRADGGYAAIHAKWFGTSPEPRS